VSLKLLKAKDVYVPIFCPSYDTQHHVSLQGLTAENEEGLGCRRAEHRYTRINYRFYHLGEEFQPLSRAKPCPEA